MLDTKRLLDQFLGGQQGQNPGAQQAQGQSPLGDVARNAGGMLSSNLGGIGGGAVAGGLVAVLLGSKSARKMAGNVDATEQANVFAQMDRLNLSSDDKAFVIDELRRPLDIDSVAQGVRTPEEAAEIYAASLLAIDVDNPAERGYLGMLAARLKLDDKLVEHLHATIEGATEKTPAPVR